MRKVLVILLFALVFLLLHTGTTTPVVVWSQEEFQLQSSYGNPVIDGTISPGEWGEWTEITMEVDYFTQYPIPAPLDVSIAVMNTGYHFYFGVQIPDQFLANRSTTDSSPWHYNLFYLWIDDGFNRTEGGWSDIYYLIRIGDPDDSEFMVDNAATNGGWMGFSNTDPTQPWCAFSFTPTDGVLGAYTFEICFPLTVDTPYQTPSDDWMNLGLHPAPVYRLIELHWGILANTNSRSYRFPSYEEDYFITSAFDPLPLIQYILLNAVFVVVVVILAWLCWRRCRSKPSEATEDTAHSR